MVTASNSTRSTLLATGRAGSPHSAVTSSRISGTNRHFS
jgi:hypothetical protein